MIKTKGIHSCVIPLEAEEEFGGAAEVLLCASLSG